MHTLRLPASLLMLLLLSACVTINVYFPAEAAEEAADLIIRDVYGETGKPEAAPTEPQSRRMTGDSLLALPGSLLDWLVPPAHAAADISVNTPAISELKSGMEARHRMLAPFYTSGAVGIANNGELRVRDQKMVPLKDRNNLNSLVSKENRDRKALYREIARANGHPEWEAEISQTFARRWVDNARAGWWYQDEGGSWKQK